VKRSAVLGGKGSPRLLKGKENERASGRVGLQREICDDASGWWKGESTS
jgi:hypothetical protein